MVNSGYTLVELLIVLSIVGLCITLASASFHSCYYEAKTSAVTEKIAQELYLARSEAIMRQKKIYYCTNDEKHWEEKRYIMDTTGVVLHTFQSLPADYHLVLYNSLKLNKTVTFTPIGFTLAQRSSFYLQSPISLTRIIINVSGRLRVTH